MDPLVVLSFHPAFHPPKSGGELRLYNIYKGLSEKYRITLVTFTYPEAKKVEVVDHAANFKEIRVPKTRVSTMLHHIVDRLSDIEECSAVVTSIESRLNGNFKRVVAGCSGDAKALIFVSPFLFTLPAKALKGKKIVYEAYNVEYELMKPSFSRSLLGKALLTYVFRIERSLSRKSGLIFAVSEEDKAGMARLYGVDPQKIRLSYNGIELAGAAPEKKTPAQDGRPVCVFIGSYHPPNIEAARKMIEMAAGMPEVTFLIAGGVTKGMISGDDRTGVPEGPGHINWHPLAKNVLLAGSIGDAEKEALYRASDIALNPMLGGSGTNIKMLDYMAAGLPIITTPTGARGLDLENGRHAIICDILEFPEKIRELVKDRTLAAGLSARGRKLVEERYEWKNISKKMAADLEKFLDA